MPIVIDFIAGVRRFLSGTDDVESALTAVSDSLDDVARDAQRSSDRMATSYERSEVDISKSTERLERDFKDLADAARDQAQRGGRETARAYDDAGKRSGEAMSEIKSEALQNAAETFSSFDGDATKFAEGIQGTFGGLIASIGPLLGPAGLLAAVAGAAGIGLITAAFTQGQEASEAMRERVSELTDELIDAGNAGSISVGHIVDKLRELAAVTDPAEVGLKKLHDVADESGSSYRDLAQAYAGNVSGLDRLLDRSKDYLASLQDEADALDTTTTAGANRYGEIMRTIDAQQQYNQYVIDARTIAEEAAAAEEFYAQSGAAAMEQRAAVIDQVNAAYDDAASSASDYINAESGMFDVSSYITSMQERETALRNYQQTLASSSLSDEAKAFLATQGADAAAAMLAGYSNASDTQKAELGRIWSEAAVDNSGEYVKVAGQELLKTNLNGPQILLTKPDANPVLEALQREFNNNPLRVPIIPVDSEGRPIP